MAERDDIKKSITLFLMEVKKKYRIKAAYIYGSHAKGCAGKWSDVDLAVISPDFSNDLYEMRLELMRMAVRIDDRLEPRPFKDESFNTNDPLASELKDHGIPFPVI
ncbi:MAG: nucleotidyltransferase domain-containing protein [Desulfobacteraceae bacterium]|jgi:predicted nucleotidyltransferase|nr:nucleotidyltransferase domain-containing protein [Desulfobacteraceae bacterium]